MGTMSVVVYLFSTGTVRPIRAGGDTGPAPEPDNGALLVLVLVLLLPVAVQHLLEQTVPLNQAGMH